MATVDEVRIQATEAWEATQKWLADKLDKCDADVAFLESLDVSVSAVSEAAAEGAVDDALNTIDSLLTD